MKNIFFIACLIIGLSSPSFAVPIANVAFDGKEDRDDGSVYSYYRNTGSLLFTHLGNTSESLDSVADLQDLLNSISGYSGFVLAATNVEYTPFGDGSSGTWMTNSVSGLIDFYSVKAGHYFAFYDVNPADSIGSWSTYDIWKIGGPGTGGHPKNGGGDLEVSHFIGYNPPAPVPEPGTILLLGAGLIGVGLWGRKRRC